MSTPYEIARVLTELALFLIASILIVDSIVLRLRIRNLRAQAKNLELEATTWSAAYWQATTPEKGDDTE